MSGLASILYPPPTKQGLVEWSYAHLIHHQAIITAALQVKNVRLTLYQIWPLNPDDLSDWLRQHQSQHNDMNSLYGVNGSDLTSLDFQNKKDTDSWFETQFYEHLDVAQKCGLPI